MERYLTKKRIIKWIASFISILFVLTMASTTIKEYLLPTVVVEEATGGKLEEKVIANGLIGRDQDLIKNKGKQIEAPIEGRVYNCVIQQYQQVSKGELLFSIKKEINNQNALQQNIRKQDLANQIKQLERNKEIQNKELDHLEQDYEKVKKELVDLVVSKEIKVSTLSIEEQEKKVALNSELYNMGIISKKEYEDSLQELENTKLNAIEFKKDKEEEIEDKLKNLEVEIGQTKNEILEIEDNQESLQKQLTLEDIEDNMMDICAPIDGYIYTATIGEGVNVEKGEELLTIIPLDIPYVLSFRVPIEQGEVVKIGDKASFLIKEEKEIGKIISKNADLESNSYLVKAELNEKILSKLYFTLDEYKKVIVEVTQSGKEYKCVVPLSAITNELGKTYIYIAEKKDTMWGETYKAKKILINQLEDNNYYTAIEATIPEKSKVIVNATKPLKDGIEIRMD